MKSSRLGVSLAVVATLVGWSVPWEAQASPWTLPRGDLALSVDYDFQTTDSEFLPDRRFQSYPLNGRFTANDFRAGARYGITPRLELAVASSMKTVSYDSDPVIPALESDTVDLAGARAAVKDFASTTTGLADAFVTGRYNFFRGAVLLTSETTLKLPTGYRGPQATFDENGDVADDVTLGDGQLDIDQSLLFGAFIRPIKTFVRAGAGARLRRGGPPPQAIGDFKFGTFIGRHLILMAGASGAFSLGEGETIGKTYIASVDGLQAEDVQVGVNIDVVDLPWAKDWVRVEGGAIFVIDDVTELRATYSQLLWGMNIAAIQSFSAGLTVRFHTFDGDDE